MSAGNNAAALRPDLGDFSSIICFRAVVTGLEQVMGEHAARGNLIRAGCMRGRNLAKSLSLTNTTTPSSDWAGMLNSAIGKSGTRLCKVERIEQHNGIIRVSLSETICSAGEPKGSPRQLTFTLGAIQGAIEEMTGRKLIGTQTGSVLRGQNHDIIDFRDAPSSR